MIEQIEAALNEIPYARLAISDEVQEQVLIKVLFIFSVNRKCIDGDDLVLCCYDTSVATYLEAV